MLNVDVATMFNPETEEMLRKSVEDCDECAKKTASLTNKGEHSNAVLCQNVQL